MIYHRNLKISYKKELDKTYNLSFKDISEREKEKVKNEEGGTIV